MPRVGSRFSALAVAGALWLGCTGAHAPLAPSAPHASLDQRVSMSLPTADGLLAAVPAPGAKVTVADFFAPTCKPCREKVPALWARRAEIESLGGVLILIGVLSDHESTADARKALADWGVPDAPFLVDSGDASKREAGVRDLPTTMIIDAASKSRWVAPPDGTAEHVVAAARAIAAR